MTPEQLGPYRIVGTLGRGGMGAVYHGIHVETDEPAAIKILAAALAGDPDFRRRFEAEIETLKKLYHPNIVQLFGFGEQDDILFYAMEYVDGSSLEEEIRHGRVFGWREVAEIGVQTCRALRHAHDRGIIHRDIKPANLLLTQDGRVKLSDFGIARLFGNTCMTAAGSVLGTAEYMAPEQADAKPVGPRSDLYSLGCVLYCLLARRPPFRAKSLMEMLEKHRSASPEPVTRWAPDTPTELELLVQQLLEKEPDRRVPSATLVARRLEVIQRALSIGGIDAQQAFHEAMQRQLNDEMPASPSQDEPAEEPADEPPAFGLPAASELPPTRLMEPGDLSPGRPVASEASPEPGISSDDGAAAEPADLGTAEPAVEKRAECDTTRSGPPLGETRMADVAMPPAGESGSTRWAAELPETRATDAFNVYEIAKAAPEPPAAPSPPVRNPRDEGDPTEVLAPKTAARTMPGRFVVVGQDELDPIETPAGPHPALVSLQTWSLALTLLTLGLTMWYFLQPPTADSLYERITRITSEKTVDSYREAESYLTSFLEYYPADPRAETFRAYKREIELDARSAQLERRAKNLATAEDLLPIERAYLEARKYAAVDPERGIEKLNALVELYKDRTDLSGPAGQCLALARRESVVWRERHEKAVGDCREELEQRLQRADSLWTTDRQTALDMLQAMVALYREKSWAADLVARAEKQIAAHRPPAGGAKP